MEAEKSVGREDRRGAFFLFLVCFCNFVFLVGRSVKCWNLQNFSSYLSYFFNYTPSTSMTFSVIENSRNDIFGKSFKFSTIIIKT